jgi:pyrroloquinoline quinone biosynthesis protein D
MSDPPGGSAPNDPLPPIDPLPGPAPADAGAGRPRLASHARLTFDEARQKYVLLTPEAVSVLNDTGAAVLRLCDGQRTLAEIMAELRGRYNHVPEHEVERFLGLLAARRSVEISHG